MWSPTWPAPSPTNHPWNYLLGSVFSETYHFTTRCERKHHERRQDNWSKTTEQQPKRPYILDNLFNSVYESQYFFYFVQPNAELERLTPIGGPFGVARFQSNQLKYILRKHTTLQPDGEVTTTQVEDSKQQNGKKNLWISSNKTSVKSLAQPRHNLENLLAIWLGRLDG